MKLSNSQLEQIRRITKVIRDPAIQQALRVQYENRNLIKYAINLAQHHQESIKHILNTTGTSSIFKDILEAIPQGSIHEQTYRAIEAVELMKSQIDDVTLNQLNNLHDYIDTNNLLQNSLLLDSHTLKSIEGYAIKIPFEDIEKSLTEYKRLSIHLEDFKSYRNQPDEYIFRTTTSETTSIGNIQLKTVLHTQFQVQELKQDFNDFKNDIKEDSKKKDEMLEELLEYFKKGGNSVVKVKKVKYNSKDAELIIDDRKVNLRADSNQHYICKILFSDNESVRKTWEIVDIVESMGEHYSNPKYWKSSIYHSIRHLNEKIQIQTGLNKFILYDNKTIIVNPKYLDLT